MASDGMPLPEALPVTPPGTVEPFVRDHLPVLRRYLRMHGAAPPVADDLAQETFLVALQKGALELPRAAAATFLQRTARFLLLHHWRDARDAVALADAVDERWQRDCEDGGDALLAALRECVRALPPRTRQAIETWYGIGGVAPPDRDAAATALGLQPNGLKTLLQRARGALRSCIERRRP